jgi:glycine/D-amino acid oxidase-like deaminating enzyme
VEEIVRQVVEQARVYPHTEPDTLLGTEWVKGHVAELAIIAREAIRLRDEQKDREIERLKLEVDEERKRIAKLVQEDGPSVAVVSGWEGHVDVHETCKAIARLVMEEPRG